MDGCISWKWVSFISHQKCVIQDVLKMTGEEVSQPSYPGVLSCVRKSVCILWLQTDQVSVAPHKGQRLEASNQTKQHECSTGAERDTKHGAHDKCWLSGPSPGHAADCAHLTLSHQSRSAYNVVTGVWLPTVVCWYRDPIHICRIKASFHWSIV